MKTKAASGRGRRLAGSGFGALFTRIENAGKTLGPTQYSSLWRRRTKCQVCGESQAEAAEFDTQKCGKGIINSFDSAWLQW
jgi:hypothetical protein